jgi:hypothetical protein
MNHCFQFQDLSLRRIEVIIQPNSFQLIHIPIVPLQTGIVSVRARSDNSQDRLFVRTRVLDEGISIETSSVLSVDLNGRSSFVGSVGGSNVGIGGVKSETTLTVSAGVVGPLFPFNITPAIGQPQVQSILLQKLLSLVCVSVMT